MFDYKVISCDEKQIVDGFLCANWIGNELLVLSI